MPVVIITGGSKGIGRGCAIAFAKAGYTVFITGRNVKDLEETVSVANTSSGKTNTHFIQCDHSNDADVEKVFDQIYALHPHVDVLVNNAYGGVDEILGKRSLPFWEKPLHVWDASHVVGLRSHYVTSALVARRMVPAKKGLIINISSAGGLQYLFDVAYGVGKAAVDRLTADTAEELRRHDVSVVSLWPGPVATEKIKQALASPHVSPEIKEGFKDAETPEFSGKCAVALAQDPNIINFSGKVLLTVEVAEQHKITDVSGHIPSAPLGKMLRQGMSLPPSQWVLPGKL